MSNADPRGKFVWHELLSGDAAAATAFYTKVVPWKSQPWEQDSSYSMWVAKNGPVGGIAKLDGKTLFDERGIVDTDGGIGLWARVTTLGCFSDVQVTPL